MGPGQRAFGGTRTSVAVERRGIGSARPVSPTLLSRPRRRAGGSGGGPGGRDPEDPAQDWRATNIHTNARVLRQMMEAGTIDLLFTTSAETLEYALEEGYDCTQIPYGYHPKLGRLLDRERDVDVLFLGDTSPPRRKEALASLAAAGIDVTVEGSWGEGGLWGEERTEYLNRTKIIVHLQRYEGRLARKRFILAMANGVLVISEPVLNPAPFVHEEHCLFATVEEMPALIRKCLDTPAERNRIARAGHGLVTGELAFSRSVAAMLERLHASTRPLCQTPDSRPHSV